MAARHHGEARPGGGCLSAKALREPIPTKVCRGPCCRELPATTEYFHRCTSNAGIGQSLLRGKCKRCKNEAQDALERKKTAIAQAAKAHAGPAKFVPRVVGEHGPSGGFTERADEGYRWVGLPDSHGHLIDWEAAEGALALVRYLKPVRIYMLGDHVDFTALSRFTASPRERCSLRDDIAAAQKFFKKVRESAPNAAILYLKGNHEARMQKYLFSKAPELADLEGVSVPRALELADYGIDWEESGAHMATPKLLFKHGHMVRMRSGYTATGEMERNGVSGVSGHTHRAGIVYKRNRTGIMAWVESGCLCQYDPDYMEGQLSDWQHAVSFGSIDLRGTGFSASVAPIVKGRVRFADKEISA